MSEETLPPLREVIKKVRELAAEKPDFVYSKPQCVYVEKGQGSCIVGQAYVALGTPIEKVSSWDYNLKGNPFSASELVEREYEEYSDNDREWLDWVQGYQDGEVPWAEAVQNADRLSGRS